MARETKAGKGATLAGQTFPGEFLFIHCPCNFFLSFRSKLDHYNSVNGLSSTLLVGKRYLSLSLKISATGVRSTGQGP